MFEQALGLIGSHGLSPVATTMAAQAAAGRGCWQAPTVFWWSCSDSMVQLVFGAGVLAGLGLLLGIAPRAAAALGYLVVISVRATEGDALRWFNWPFDSLLAESLFLAIWLSPSGSWSSPWRPVAPRPWARWLVLWLLFRLLLGTGVTKLLVGGPWFELVAVQHFLLTQPFPSAWAAAMHDGPRWLLQAACVYTMAYELIAPWLLWWPGRVARWAGLLGIPLMVGIYAIGSFRGFNHVTIGMLLLTIDDATWQRWFARLPAAWRPEFAAVAVPASTRRSVLAGTVVVGLVAAASFEPVALQAGAGVEALPAAPLRAALRPFHLAANYWVFCQIPSERYGLVVQGSDDGVVWHDYELRGLRTANRCPPVHVAPGNDHFGFLVWLSGFGPPEVAGGWLPALLAALLRGEPTVRGLFAYDPFPAAPPRHVRVLQCHYRFASPDQRAVGVFWERRELGVHGTASR
jgi:hypothetical protein